MIEFKNIGLAFNDKTIFDNFNLKIEKGEKVGLRAPSGKGKTTLLKMLIGQHQANKGQIIVNQQILNENTIHNIRKQIVWIPQNIHLPVDNGQQLAEWLNLTKNHDEIDNILSEIGLDPSMLDMNFNQISGGQKQRMIIALCCSIPKPIILMDEPTSSLDDDTILLFTNYIGRQTNKTILCASHNNTFLNQLNRIIEL